MEINTSELSFIEEVEGKRVEYSMVETWDGLYTPVAVRKPIGDGPFPIVLMAAGNGGEGLPWLMDAIRNRAYTMDRLVEAGFACAWLRYRTEVELGYNNGGKMVRDMRQGREMFNRSPLEYEDEIAIIDYFKTKSWVDSNRIGVIGMSHGGEMALKIVSEYHGLAAAVASEPASHEYLALMPDDTAFVNEKTGLRNIEEMQMAEVEKVRKRIDMVIAKERIQGITTPVLVMGRDEDHLQGIFKTSFDLLNEAGKNVEWVSYDHDYHGYVFPIKGDDGKYILNDVQIGAIDHVVSWLGKKFSESKL
jgi:dipeptidyl aminopeptidase/acylaminoacyl peptidase